MRSVYRKGMTTKDAVKEVAKALSIAIKRNAATGNSVNIAVITKDGYREVIGQGARKDRRQVSFLFLMPLWMGLVGPIDRKSGLYTNLVSDAVNTLENGEDKTKEFTEGISRKIKEMLPEEVGFVKAEFEGPDIVIVLKNSKAIYADENIVRNIASTIKKKLVIRSLDSSLMAEKSAEEFIRGVVPETAVIEYIRFVREFSEVYISALKPGLVIGKGGICSRA